MTRSNRSGLAAREGPKMDPELERVLRENTYLKQRCTQLQDDVDNLNSQVTRLTQQLDHHAVRWNAPNPLSGGQSR